MVHVLCHCCIQIQEHREAVTLKIQTGVIQSPMKGQAASSGAGGGGGVGKGGSSAPPKAVAKAPPPSTTTDEPPPAEDKPVMKKKRVCLYMCVCVCERERFILTHAVPFPIVSVPISAACNTVCTYCVCMFQPYHYNFILFSKCIIIHVL